MSRKKKVWNIISYVLIGLFGLVAVSFLVTSLVYKTNGKSLTIGGNEVRLVQSGSMEWSKDTPDEVKQYEIKNIDTYDAVFISKVTSDKEKANLTFANYKVGDVVTFYYVNGGQRVIVTHRIAQKDAYGNGYIFAMKGDNYSKGTPSTQYVYTATDKENPLPLNEMIGKVTKVSKALGNFMNFVSSKWCIICLVIIPGSLIILYEGYRIIAFVYKDKKLAYKAEKASKDDEIERLKALLNEKEEELKKQKKDE